MQREGGEELENFIPDLSMHAISDEKFSSGLVNMRVSNM